MKRSISALLILLTVACRHGVVSAPEPSLAIRNPIPDSVDSPFGPVPVVWVNEIPTDMPNMTVLGRFDPIERRILLWEGIRSPEERWRTFVHETCHLWHWDYGVRVFHDIVERMCDAVAYGLAPRLMRESK